MSKATAIHDPEADAISVRFAPPAAQYAESEEVAPGVVLDYDAQGGSGIELLYVRDLLATGNAQAADEEATAAE